MHPDADVDPSRQMQPDTQAPADAHKPAASDKQSVNVLPETGPLSAELFRTAMQVLARSAMLGGTRQSTWSGLDWNIYILHTGTARW